MKKLALTIAIVLTMGLCASAQSLLQKEHMDYVPGDRDDITTPSIPYIHGNANDQNGDGAPLGSGVVVLLGMGAAYAMKKKREK